MFQRLALFLRRITGKLGDVLAFYPGVRTLTYICVCVYLVQSTLAEMSDNGQAQGIFRLIFDSLFGLNWPLLKSGAFWQPLSFNFLHGSFFHLVLNLFSLIFFGYAVEQMLGTQRFWLLFLCSGILGGLGWMICDLAEPRFWLTISHLGPIGQSLAQRWISIQSHFHGPHICVGASAGVYGLMGAFVALRPREKITILLFYVLPITLQARLLAILLVLVNIFQHIVSFGNVAFAAHIFGLLVGLLYAYHLRPPRSYNFF